MEGRSKSQLYQFLSEVGIKAVSPGRIDFYSVDIERALDAIVADGDNFLLETLYSYAVPDVALGLRVMVGNPERVPDMSKLTEDLEEEFYSNDSAVYEFGKWTKLLFFDVDTDGLKKFDPVSFSPRPTNLISLDTVESYGRVYNLVRKAKTQGYKPIRIELGEYDTWSGHNHLVLGKASVIDDDATYSNYFFEFNSHKLARRLYGHLIPGLRE